MASRPETSAPSRSCCHPVWFRRRVRRQLFLVAKDREDALWDNVAAFIPGSRQIVRNLVGFDRLVQPGRPLPARFLVVGMPVADEAPVTRGARLGGIGLGGCHGPGDFLERSTLKCQPRCCTIYRRAAGDAANSLGTRLSLGLSKSLGTGRERGRLMVLWETAKAEIM